MVDSSGIELPKLARRIPVFGGFNTRWADLPHMCLKITSLIQVCQTRVPISTLISPIRIIPGLQLKPRIPESPGSKTEIYLPIPAPTDAIVLTNDLIDSLDAR